MHRTNSEESKAINSSLFCLSKNPNLLNTNVIINNKSIPDRIEKTNIHMEITGSARIKIFVEILVLSVILFLSFIILFGSKICTNPSLTKKIVSLSSSRPSRTNF